MAHIHPLDGDGIQTQLFHYLWKRGQGLEVEQKLHSMKIPDTIVFYNFPIMWYFWSEHNGEVRKKGGKALERTNILRTFCKRRNPEATDIVASFLSHRTDTEDTITFLNEQDLAKFLFDKPIHQGLLQRFMLPRGAHNEMIQAVWSPRLCLINKRVNRLLLNDRHCNRTDKCITFEGATHFTEEALTAKSVRAKIENVCRSFVDHFKTVEHHYSVSRMVLYFKEDAWDNSVVWLHFSSSFRITELKYKASGFQQRKPPMSLTPQFQGLHNAAAEEKLKAEKDGKARSGPKPYRGPRPKPGTMQDVTDLIKSGRLADADEGIALGLTPMTELPLPTTLRQAVADGDSSPKSRHPNDGIKYEMLVDRHVFNKKTQQARADVQKWDTENDRILADLKMFTEKRRELVSGLSICRSLSISMKPVSFTQSLRPRSLPSLAQSMLTSLGNTHVTCDGDLSAETTLRELSLSPTSPMRPEPSLSPVLGSPAGRSKSRPCVLSASAVAQSLEFMSAEQLDWQPEGAFAGAVSPATTLAELKRSHKMKLDEEANRLEQSREWTAPSQGESLTDIVTGGVQAFQMVRRATNRLRRGTRQTTDMPTNPEEVQRIMAVIEASYAHYCKDQTLVGMVLADELDDQIYSCYSDTSLAHKPAKHYFFSLRRSLAALVEDQFGEDCVALNILRESQFMELQAARDGRRLEATAERVGQAPTSRPSAASPSRSVRSVSPASPSSFTLVSDELWSANSGVTLRSATPLVPRGTAPIPTPRAPGTEEEEVRYAIVECTTNTLKDFQRLMVKVRNFLMSEAQRHERECVEAITAQVRRMQYVRLMSSIRNKGGVQLPSTSFSFCSNASFSEFSHRSRSISRSRSMSRSRSLIRSPSQNRMSSSAGTASEDAGEGATPTRKPSLLGLVQALATAP
mmetsp:Transcript_71691/g.126215  ORF Transcript_71691/g.126215 Transcript_71691/m.126215 type:complete len:914 (-) Transcript_71691:76-2817(-)